MSTIFGFIKYKANYMLLKKKLCILGIWTGTDFPMKVQYIERDDNIWKLNMESQLIQFYYGCILPELVDPRYTRNMPIRD